MCGYGIYHDRTHDECYIYHEIHIDLEQTEHSLITN